jgi:hypothetical protein
VRTPNAQAQQPGSSPAADPDRFDGIGTKPRPVSVRVVEDTLVRVEDESGAAIWMGRMQAGESRRWPVTGEVTVRARNASAVTAQLGTDDPVVVGSSDAPDEVTLGKS